MFRVYSPCCSKRYVVYSVGSCVMLVVGWCSTQRTAHGFVKQLQSFMPMNMAIVVCGVY